LARVGAAAARTPLLRTQLPVLSAATGIRLSSSSTALASDDHTYDYALKKLDGDAQERRAFNYMVLGGARFIYASATRLIAMKFIASMSASADVLALASTEVDIGQIEEGAAITVKWRGKPVFVRHRSDDEIAKVAKTPLSDLKDPQSDADRAQNPSWLVVLGVCTHLGCVPINGAGDFGGYFCPCHGSHYDASGRIRKGPAPANLEIPPYALDLDEGKLLIG